MPKRPHPPEEICSVQMARNARTPPCPTPTPAPTIAQCHSIPSIRIERSKDENGISKEIVSAPKPTPPPRTVTYGNTLMPTANRLPRQPRQTSLRSRKSFYSVLQ